MSTKRIGILTSGGDCPGLNAVIRGVVKSAAATWLRLHRLPAWLRRAGRSGQLHPAQSNKNTSGILNRGGTILGSTNKGRFVAAHGRRPQIASDIDAGTAGRSVKSPPTDPPTQHRKASSASAATVRWRLPNSSTNTAFPSSACRRRSTTISRQRRTRSVSTAPWPVRLTRWTDCTPRPRPTIA